MAEQSEDWTGARDFLHASCTWHGLGVSWAGDLAENRGYFPRSLDFSVNRKALCTISGEGEIQLSYIP